MVMSDFKPTSDSAHSKEISARPTRPTPEMRHHAASLLVDELGPETEAEKERMITALSLCPAWYRNGYEMAKWLESNHYWEPDAQMVETLDSFRHMVDSQIEKAQEQWVIDNNIKPPLPLGTRVAIASVYRGTEHGTLAHLFKYGPAKYSVKMDGDTSGGFRIVNYEDAIPIGVSDGAK